MPTKLKKAYRIYEKTSSHISLDILNIIGSIIMIFLFLWILVYASSFWINNYPSESNDFGYQMFYLALGIAFITSIAQWMEGRAKSMIKSAENLIVKKHDIIKNKKEERYNG